MTAVLDKVQAFIDQHQLVRPGDTLVVAVSGGPDSVCLLHVLHELRAVHDLHLHVAHLNHRLRGPAGDEDAAFVARLAAGWNLPATVSVRDVPAYQQAHGLSLEAAARQVRYAFLADVVAQTGAAGVALGHTASDQVETVVIHWLRGAGPAGLRGMLPDQTLRVQEGQAVRLIRPLLAVTRAEVEAHCAAYDLAFRDDLSNLDETILRNRVRRRLLPVLREYNPNLDVAFRRAAAGFAEISRFLQDQVNAAWPTVVRDEWPGAISFRRDAWQGLDPAVQRGLVREAVSRLLWGAPLDLGWDHVEAVLDLVARGATGAETHLPHDLVAVLDYDAVVLGHPAALGVPPNGLYLSVDRLSLSVPGVTLLPGTPWSLEAAWDAPVEPVEALVPPPSAHCVYVDADRAGVDLVLRHRRPGDRFRPLGSAGSRKLKDFFIDAHVPRRWRDGVPLLVNADDRVLWVVGHRIAEDVRITPGTRRVLRLRVQQDQDVV